jgi:hypothetical protein
MTDVQAEDLVPGQLVVLSPDLEKTRIPRATLNQFYGRSARLVEVHGQECVLASLRHSEVVRVPTADVQRLSSQLFPEKDSQRRAILYLDQCIISQLVKHQRDELEGKDAAAAEVLGKAIDEAVFERGTAICVDSAYHETESSAFVATGSRRGRTLFRQLWDYLSPRTRGLRLRAGSEILQSQAVQRTALTDGSVVMRAHELWRLAFERNPSDPAEDTVDVPWRPLPPGPAYAADLERGREAGEFGSFDEELTKAIDQMRTAELWNHRLFPWNRRWSSDPTQTPTDAAVKATIEGEQFDELPFVHCKCRLVASLLSEATRRFRDSDFIDMLFASSALPYCHLMIVDRNLATRIRNHRLDGRYGTRVFGSGPDEYWAAASWIRSWSERGTRTA